MITQIDNRNKYDDFMICVLKTHSTTIQLKLRTKVWVGNNCWKIEHCQI